MLGGGPGRRCVAAASRHAQLPPLFLCPSVSSIRVAPRRVRHASSASGEASVSTRRRSSDAGLIDSQGLSQADKLKASATGETARGRRRDVDESKGEGTSASAGNLENNRSNELLMVREIANDVISKGASKLEAENEVVLQEAKRLLLDFTNTGLGEEDEATLAETTLRLALAFSSANQEKDAFELLQASAQRGVDLSMASWRSLFESDKLRADVITDLFDLARQLCGDEIALAEDDIVEAYCQALCKQGREREISNLLGDYEGLGKAAPRCVFELLLDVQLRQKNSIQARRTLRKMGTQHSEVDVKALLLVMLHGRASLRKDILDIIDETSARQRKPKAAVLHDLITQLCDRGDAKGILTALRVFGAPTRALTTQRAAAAACRPMQATYLSIVRMFARSNQPRHALRFAALAMDEAWCFIDKRGQTAVVTAMLDVVEAFNRIGRHAEALQVGAHLIDVQQPLSTLDLSTTLANCQLPPRGSVAPSRRIYAALLRSTTRLPLPQVVPTARALLLDLGSHGKVMDGAVRMAFMEVMLATMRHVKKAQVFKVFDDIMRAVPDLSSPQALFDPTTVTLKRDGKVHEREVDVHNLTQFVGLLKQRGALDQLLIAVDRDNRRQRRGRYPEPEVTPPETMDAQEWMQEADMSPTPHSQALNPDGVDSTCAAEREMNLEEKLSTEAYALRLKVYAVLRLDHASAQAIYRSMVTHGVPPSMLHVAPVVEGLVASGRMKEAIDVQRGAKDALGQDTTLRIYAAVARGFARRKDWKGVRAVFAEMRDDGVEPDQTLLGVVAAAERRVTSSSGSPAPREYSQRLVSMVQSSPGSLTDEKKRERQNTQSIYNTTTVETATSTFATLMNQGRCLEAQQYMYQHLVSPSALWASSSPLSLERADAVLRRQVHRSSHWIKREMDKLQDAGAGRQGYESQMARLKEASELVKLNRRLAKGPAPRRTRARHEESQARSSFLRLFWDAVVTRYLFDEAHKVGRRPLQKSTSD